MTDLLNQHGAVFLPSELDILVHWIRERDSIRAKKEAGLPKPWTADRLLRDYRWCNVRRMDDRVSQWLLKSWYPGLESRRQCQLHAALLGRLINWPDSLAVIRSAFPAHDSMQSLLKELKAAGGKIFTGAYVIPGRPGEDKIDTILELAGKSAVHTKFEETQTMRSTWARLMEFDGMGSFLSGQVVADLAFLPYGLKWPDRATWAPLGPGSARGINRVQGKPKDAPVKQQEFDVLLPQLCATLRPVIADIWDNRQLIAMDIQNCLCEFDKYRRLTLGEGKVRARYDGAGQCQQQESLL